MQTLTYKDRLNLLREAKIRHTLEKRTQNGYMNADDYGTVPHPEGYSFKPVENLRFGGYKGMSENFKKMLAGHPVYVDPLEILCCRWRDMLSNYRGGGRWDYEKYPFDELRPNQELYNLNSGIESDSHFACDYRIGMEIGFGGLLEKIRKYREINGDEMGFYEAEEMCVIAIIDFIDRHIAEIERLLSIETRPEIVKTLEMMLTANKKVRYDPPETFIEACQWAAYFNCVSRIYTRDGAGFQLDTILKPYYDNDVKNGTLNDETAKFIIADLLLIDPHYYQVSGVDEFDNDITNHLSYLILEAANDINISANITVRVHENCDKKFLRRAVECLFINKNGWPRFSGDKSLVEGYMKTGYSKKIARDRIAVGCNWMCIPGLEFPMNDCVKINIARVLEAALNDMKTMPEKSTATLFDLYKKHLVKATETAAAGINLHIDCIWDNTPELVMNLMMKNTIEQGKDISQCAEIYTMGIDGAGLAVVADSFGALEERVENEQILTWDDIYTNLENNYDSVKGERVRQILSSTERYCHGDTAADRWAEKLRDNFNETLRAQEMPEGRQLVPGWFSWSNTIEFGKRTGATPNGRKSGEPISHGCNPNPGFRGDGAVTALANGIAMVQPGYGNTAPLQLEFDPKITVEEGGIERVMNLITTHLDMGGTLININVLDKDKLMKAHENPDLYPDLVVRVTGFTAYFATLSPEFRQLVVSRFIDGF